MAKADKKPESTTVGGSPSSTPTPSRALTEAARSFTPRQWKLLKAACRLRAKGYRCPGGEANAAKVLARHELVEFDPARAGVVRGTDLGRALAAAHERHATGQDLPDAD